jgi:hypothetical protein
MAEAAGLLGLTRNAGTGAPHVSQKRYSSTVTRPRLKDGEPPELAMPPSINWNQMIGSFSLYLMKAGCSMDAATKIIELAKTTRSFVDLGRDLSERAQKFHATCYGVRIPEVVVCQMWICSF